MKLHNNKPLFDDAVSAAADGLGLSPEFVRKDYFIFLFLKALSQIEENILFKGGTSLSKCYRIIDRFSEDIDLAYMIGHQFPSQKQRQELYEQIKNLIEQLGFTLLNPEKVKSRQKINTFSIQTDNFSGNNFTKDSMTIETSYATRSFPTERKSVSSYITDMLIKNKLDDVLEIYELSPFEMNVQSLERTFIDKVFAICDYHLASKITEKSRHIYDLYQLYPQVTMNGDFRKLVRETRTARQENHRCLSADDAYNIHGLLEEIYRTHVYKDDYNRVTNKMLFKPLSYEAAIGVIPMIVKANMFS